ncbi:conserved hypothetical protein [Neospora caninum Liverpool]|uniref:Vps54 family protein n=1 Tax=Neospora caninum (strain Liverpool) TaxID=572307 RepID=F0V7R3_NEOCL|nr:conserved hypothetical protein [Neospora caninum Liverpool]CBZ49754.1 conserved hypothetical protein [Neospora caninum Liverpool]CEL64339.1 TPA: Vps54 family protein [Neospora caninum Liverpool]|eukprot:XP_003879789.1 conserved hypothetical protein [Neospora caninum Liverpool]
MAEPTRELVLPPRGDEEESNCSSGCLSPQWQGNLMEELQAAQSISAVVNVPGALEPSSVFSFLSEGSLFASSLEEPADFSPRRASAGLAPKEISLSDFDGYFNSLKEELSQFEAICADDREALKARDGGTLSLSARRRENAELLVASTRRMQGSRFPPSGAVRPRRDRRLPRGERRRERERSETRDADAKKEDSAAFAEKRGRGKDGSLGERRGEEEPEDDGLERNERGGIDHEQLLLYGDDDDEEFVEGTLTCSSVPECFFSPDFQLSDFLCYDLAEAVKVHDEFSTCLDEVECSLVSLLSRRFSFFVSSLWKLTSMQSEMEGALRTVASLRGEIKKMQAERVELGLKVLRLTKERQGLLVHLRRMEFLSYVRDCLQSLDILLQAKEFATCLRLIEATRAVMNQELAALHVARPIRLQLDELQHRITTSLIDDFAAASLAAVFPAHCDPQSPTLVSSLHAVLTSPSSSSPSSSPSFSSSSSSSSSPSSSSPSSFSASSSPSFSSSSSSSSHAVAAARRLAPVIRPVVRVDVLHARLGTVEQRQEQTEKDSSDSLDSQISSALTALYGDWARGWTLQVEEEEANPFDDRGVFTWEQRLISCVGMAPESLQGLNLLSRCEGNASMMIARARQSFSSATKSAMRTVASRAVMKYSCASPAPRQASSLPSRLATDSEEEEPPKCRLPLREGSRHAHASTDPQETCQAPSSPHFPPSSEPSSEQASRRSLSLVIPSRDEDGDREIEQAGDQEGDQERYQEGEQETVERSGRRLSSSRSVSRGEGEKDEPRPSGSEGRENAEAGHFGGDGEAAGESAVCFAATAGEGGSSGGRVTVGQSEEQRGISQEASEETGEKRKAEGQEGEEVQKAAKREGREDQREASRSARVPAPAPPSPGLPTEKPRPSDPAPPPEGPGPHQLAEALTKLEPRAFWGVWSDCLGFCLAVARRLEAWTCLVLMRTVELSLAARLKKEELARAEKGPEARGDHGVAPRQTGAAEETRKDSCRSPQGDGSQAEDIGREERKKEGSAFTVSQAESLGKRVDAQTRQWRIIAADLARLAETVVQALVAKCSSMLQLRAEPHCRMRPEHLAQLYWTSLSAMGCLYTLQQRFHKRLTEVLLQSLRVTVHLLLSPDQLRSQAPGASLLSPAASSRPRSRTESGVAAEEEREEATTDTHSASDLGPRGEARDDGGMEETRIGGLDDAAENDEEEDAVGSQSFLRLLDDVDGQSSSPLHLQVDNLSLQLAVPAAASLKSQLFLRAKMLLESFHEAKLAQVNVILENETWERADVPVSFVPTLETIHRFPFFSAPLPCSSPRCPSRRQTQARRRGEGSGREEAGGASLDCSGQPGALSEVRDDRSGVASDEGPEPQRASLPGSKGESGSSQEVVVCACDCWSCTLSPRCLTINNEAFMVVPSCLLAIQILSEYLSLLRLLPLLLPLVLSSLAHVLQHFSRVSLQLTVEGGAVKRGRLPRITSAALALCARSCACLGEVLALLLRRIDSQQKRVSGKRRISLEAAESPGGREGEDGSDALLPWPEELAFETAHEETAGDDGATRSQAPRADSTEGRDTHGSRGEEEVDTRRAGEREEASTPASRQCRVFLAPVPPLLSPLPKALASQMGLGPVDPHSRASQVLQQTCQVLAGAQAKVYQKIGDILIDRFEVHSARWLSTAHPPSMMAEFASSSTSGSAGAAGASVGQATAATDDQRQRTESQRGEREQEARPDGSEGREGNTNRPPSTLSNGSPQDVQQIPAPPPHDALKGFVKDASSLYKVLHRLLPADAVSKIFARTFHQISYRFETRLTAAFSHQAFPAPLAFPPAPSGLAHGSVDSGTARDNSAHTPSNGHSTAGEGMQRRAQGAEGADSSILDSQAAGTLPQGGSLVGTGPPAPGDDGGRLTTPGQTSGSGSPPGSDETLDSAGSRKEGVSWTGSPATEPSGRDAGGLRAGGQGSPAPGMDAVQVRINSHLGGGEKKAVHAVYSTAQGETMGDRYWLDCVYLYESLCRLEDLRIPLLHLVRDLLSACSKCWTVSPGVAELIERRLPRGE